jgi:hypothetical protein
MATLLRDKDSSEKYLSAGRRHCRLCKEIPGCEPFSVTIQPSLKTLEEKVELTKAAIINREDALDVTRLNDRMVNQAVKTLYERTSQHDRENVGAGMIVKLFPDGKLSTITLLEKTKKVDAVDMLVKRAGTLDTNHPLAAPLQALQTQTAAARTAITNYNTATYNVKMASAEETIAKAEVRRMYEANYLDARKAFGKDVAESIFPDLMSSANTEKESVPAVVAPVGEGVGSSK